MLAEVAREKNLIVVTSTSDLREVSNIVALTHSDKR